MEMSATQKVGQEIKKVRYRMGLTQKALGKLIGKSESQIGAYENASASITLDVLFKIAEVTKIKPEELITGPAKKEEKTGWDAELRIYGLEDRKTVMTILAVNGYDVGQHKKQATPTGKEKMEGQQVTMQYIAMLSGIYLPEDTEEEDTENVQNLD